MENIFTLAQIESQFDAEWVLIDNPETNPALEIQTGQVLWHSKNRDEVYQKAIELRPKRFAIFYTGQMAEDAAIVL